MAPVTQPTDVVSAEQAWADLRSALANFDTALQRVVETRAWEPLGYATFAEAWADRMRGIRLGTASMAAHVVYALIDSGLDREQALLTLGPSSGVGPTKFDVLARQKKSGVPPHLATTHVRGHLRAAPSPARTVHVELTPSEYEHFRAVADTLGRDLASEAAKAVRSHFRVLERRGGERHAV